MEECSFKNGSRSRTERGWWHSAASLRKRKGRSTEKSEGEMKKRKGISRREILQKKAQLAGEKVDEGERRGTEGRSGFEAREEEGSCCFHILAEEREYREQTSGSMVNEELGQQTGSFHFLPLSQLGEEGGKGGEEKGCKEEESCSMATLKEEKTRFQILSSALSEELKYELYLVQNL